MSETRVREAIERAAVGCASALDIGCGPIGDGLRTKYQVACRIYVGMDPRIPSLGAVRGTHLYVHGEAPGGSLARFGDDSFDLVYALDVIEHFQASRMRRDRT